MGKPTQRIGLSRWWSAPAVIGPSAEGTWPILLCIDISDGRPYYNSALALLATVILMLPRHIKEQDLNDGPAVIQYIKTVFEEET